jgi:hypothetical protein
MLDRGRGLYLRDRDGDSRLAIDDGVLAEEDDLPRS